MIPVLRVKVTIQAVDLDGAGILEVVGGPAKWLVVDQDDFGPVLRWSIREVQDERSPAQPAGTSRVEALEGREP